MATLYVLIKLLLETTLKSKNQPSLVQKLIFKKF